MPESYKDQNIIRLNSDKIGDIHLEVVVVVPGFGGQPLAFIGKGPTRDSALNEARRMAREAIDKGP